jgi:hypothetical protein
MTETAGRGADNKRNPQKTPARDEPTETADRGADNKRSPQKTPARDEPTETADRGAENKRSPKGRRIVTSPPKRRAEVQAIR